MLPRVALIVAWFAATGAQAPRVVRTPKRRARRVAEIAVDAPVLPGGGGGDGAPDGPVDNETEARQRSLRDRITMTPTSFPTIAYDGYLEPPLILPRSGTTNAAVGITFLHPEPDITIHCERDGSEPTRWSPRYAAGGMIHMSGTENPTLTLRCLARAPSTANGQKLRDSAIVTRTYEVQMGTFDYDRSGYTGRVGMAFLVPYYRGQNYIDTTEDYDPSPSGHSAKLPSIDLNTSTYKSVRIHGVETDFAEYYTYDYLGDAAAVVYKGEFVPATLQYQRGTGAYEGQVRVHDVASYGGDPMLRGFFHGFVQEHARRNSTVRETTRYRYHRRFFVSDAELRAEIKHGCEPRERLDPVHRSKNTSRTSVETYGFLAPYFDGVSYSGKAVRLKLGTTLQAVEVTETVSNASTCCVVNKTKELCVFNATTASNGGAVTLETREDFREGNATAEDADGRAPDLTTTIDLTEANARLRGFVGGFAVGDSAYFVPHFDGRNPGHVVARVDAVKFSGDTVEFLDLWDVDATLAGFFGGFGYTTTGPVGPAGVEYGFLVPHCAIYGPVGGVNSQFPADSWSHANTSNLDYSDSRSTSLRNGERRWYENGGYPRSEFGTVGSQRVAVGGDRTVEHFHGRVVRLRLSNFSTGNAADAVDVLDLTRIDPDLRGFAGGSVVGRYGLLVPYKNRPGDDGFFGKLVRLNLETFEVDSVLDLTRIAINSETTEIAGDALRGFVGGVHFGKYLVLVPHRNGKRDTNYNKRDHSSLVVRVDMDDFTLETGVKVIDLGRVARQQIPSEPDNELRGFLFGFAMGEYAYLVPHFSRDFYGKLVRVDMRDFENLATLQANDESTLVEVGSPGAYTGVQYIDLERTDRDLVGFSGGFAVRSAEPQFSKPLGTPEARSEWWESSMGVALNDADADEPETTADHLAHVVRSDVVRNCVGWQDACDRRPKGDECDCANVASDLPPLYTLHPDSEFLEGSTGLSEMEVPHD